MQHHYQGQCHTFESPAVLTAVYSVFVFCSSDKKKHGSSTDEADTAFTEFLKCQSDIASTHTRSQTRQL